MTTQATQPPAKTSLTREDVLRLGQAGRPWEFLPVAARAIDLAPDDQAIRFLISANLARLGLKTLAGEQLDALPAEAQGHPDIKSLRGALASLPSDRVSTSQLGATCDANIAAMERRGLCLSGYLGRWSEGLSKAMVFRALDGNVVRRVGSGPLSACWPLGDHAAAARRFVQTNDSLTKPACIIVEGTDPPWMFREIFDATPAQALGFRVPLFVVQSDPLELLDGLSLVNLSGRLADTRVRLFVGPDASQQLEEHLASRIDYQVSSFYVPVATTRTRAAPAVQSVIQNTLARQEAEFLRLRGRVEAVYAGRDQAWWARRYRGAAAGGPPLKVLIPTCRYSTFIKHSSADLCATLNRQGHIAELYHEPDDMAKLTGVGYLRAFERFQPDLVVLINFPRASMGESMPANVPFVCWVQDSMPQLFDAAIGAAQGPLDFIIGHTFIELFQKYGYPTERAMPISVVADEAKFHPSRCGRVDAGCGMLKGKTSDIAFVSHHSETPEAMHRRLCSETAHAPAIAQVFEELYPDVRAAVANAAAAPAMLILQQAAAKRLREILGHEPEQRTATLVLRQYAGPLADRMLRHQTLGWAAEVAARRGWRLSIYGRGWDKHPTLAAFAHPELAHGEELRACYESSTVHLHVAGSTLTHQRVIECFLSGGLCLCRMHRDAVSAARQNTQLSLLRHAPDVVDEENAQVGYTIADHPEAMGLANTLAEAGYPYEGPVLWIPQIRAISHGRFGSILAPDQDPTFLLRDLSETTFSTMQELETLVARAVESPSWRSAVTGMVAARAREFLTHDALARRTLELVRGSLGALQLREAV